MKTPPVQTGQIVEVTIDRLTIGGAGLSRVEGFVIFTPFTVPGDVAQIEIQDVKKGYANASLKKVLAPSPKRIKAPCRYFGICGGCDWQNLEYHEQLKAKEGLVDEALKKFHLEPQERLPALASSQIFHYRNRIQLHQYNGHFGFKAARSNAIVDLDDCLIAENAIAEKIQEIRDKTPQKSGRVDIRKTRSNSVSVTYVDEDEVELSFSQVNTEQNQRMIDALTSWVSEAKSSTFLDLYCGSGNLTFPLHHKIKPQKTLAVEMNSQAIAEGRLMAKASVNIEFFSEPVDRFLQKQLQDGSIIVVLDPPRAGAGINVMKQLARLKPEIILYVSCDPITWARDIQALLVGGEFRLQKVQALDMFPQTAHIEILSMIVPA